MDYGPPAWLAYGLAGTGAVLFLIRALYLAGHPDEVMGPPRWSNLSKILILTAYGFLFFIQDQFGLMLITVALIVALLGIQIIRSL